MRCKILKWGKCATLSAGNISLNHQKWADIKFHKFPISLLPPQFHLLDQLSRSRVRPIARTWREKNKIFNLSSCVFLHNSRPSAWEDFPNHFRIHTLISIHVKMFRQEREREHGEVRNSIRKVSFSVIKILNFAALWKISENPRADFNIVCWLCVRRADDKRESSNFEKKSWETLNSCTWLLLLHFCQRIWAKKCELLLYPHKNGSFGKHESSLCEFSTKKKFYGEENFLIKKERERRKVTQHHQLKQTTFFFPLWWSLR